MNNVYIQDKINDLVPFGGIYKLFASEGGNEVLVYIGKSKNVRRRIRDHVKNKFMFFDDFTYDFYPVRMLDELERKIIGQYFGEKGHLPKFNKQLG